MSIAFDFDGVVHRYRKGWADGTIYDQPVEGALEGLVSLLAKGESVFILSTRDPQQIKRWFEGVAHFPYPVEEIPVDVKFWNKPKVLGVTNRKLPATHYVDDRAVRFTNWRDILNYF